MQKMIILNSVNSNIFLLINSSLNELYNAAVITQVKIRVVKMLFNCIDRSKSTWHYFLIFSEFHKTLLKRKAVSILELVFSKTEWSNKKILIVLTG